MASTSESTSIVKSDRAGRSRSSAEYKAEVVAAFEGSGMSGPAFAKQCGLKYPTFAAWVAKSRSRRGHIAGVIRRGSVFQAFAGRR